MASRSALALALGLSLAWSAPALAQPQPPAAPNLATGAAVEEDDTGDSALPDPATSAALADHRPITVVSLLPPTEVLARGQGLSVTAGELYAALADAPPPLLRRYVQDPAALRALLDRMVADRLLAAEARRLGLDRDAVVVAAVERALVSRLRATVLNPRAGGTEVVTDEDVRRWYDAHPDRFHIPERRRARAIFLTDRAEATRVLRLALLRRGRRYRNDFRRLAAEHNAAPDLRATRGELHELARAPWPYAVPLDPAARDAVFAMAREGDVVPRVVEGAWQGTPGFFVLRYVARRAPIERSLDDSREWVRHRIALERRVAAEQAEIERLAAEAHLTRLPVDRAVRLDPG
ncbi:MAG: peptidyl-prolyl cis-trans isomerase [Myxococcales bacterium]|nr:peptidyl-prolyl cis-trans isomerase [Myxococcales bacterium]